MRTFWGYERPDGQVGVRNHVLIVSLMDLTNGVAQKAAGLVKGAIPICPSFGRSQAGADEDMHYKELAGLIANANVHSAVLVSMEPVSCKRIKETVAFTGKKVESFYFGQFGGSLDFISAAAKAAKNLMIEASTESRKEFPISKIILGTECGASDTTSGIVTNPVTGLVADKFVEAGSSVVVSETLEWVGAEHILASRAKTPEVGDKIINRIKELEEYINKIGIDVRGSNPSPDNIAGGLTSIEEKSLGGIEKSGHTPIIDMLECGSRPTQPGLFLMDAPCAGVENMTAQAAGGCNIIIFTTGQGNPIGNPIAPTIKVTGNSKSVAKNSDNFDLDFSFVITEDMSMSDACDSLLDEVIRVANGKLTCAEVYGQEDISVTRLGYSF